MSSIETVKYRVPLWVVVALSGVAALCHELLWTRRLLDVLGSSTTAHARVLGAFFLGLSLGAALASRVVTNIKRPWRALAMAEGFIALLSVPALSLPEWSFWIWPAVGVGGLTSPLGAGVKLLVSFVVVVPPAVAMGFTLPLAVASLGARAPQTSRDATRLYALNTMGAVVGIMAVSVWLLAAFGLTGSMWVAIGLNLTAALIALTFEPAVDSVGRVPSPTPKKVPLPIIGLSFLSGAGVLAIEVIALQLLMLVATMSFYAPAAILGTMIAMLATAAVVAPAIFRTTNFGPAMSITLATGGLVVAAAPLIYWALVQGGGFSSMAEGVSEFVTQLFILTAAFIGLGALAVGSAFPLLMGYVNRASASGTAGAVASLLAANGVGGLVGAEISNQVLLPVLGPHVALGFVGGVYCFVAVAVLLAWPMSQRLRLRLAVYATFCAMGALAFSLFLLPRLPTINPHLGFDVVAETTDRHGTLAVVDHVRLGRAMVVNNQYVLGSTAAAFEQERQSHLPMLLHRKPERIALIGLATGSSAGASLLHEPVARVEVLELSPAVIAGAQEYFADENRHVVDDPRVHILEEDGRTYMSATRDRFDLIVGDLFLPWSTGVGRLYSAEHFAAVRRALRDDGVFCQWLPMYQLSEPQFDIIVASLLTAFPEVHLFRNTFRPDKPSLGLVAFKDTELSWSVISDRAAATRSLSQIDDPSVRHGVAVAMLYLGRVQKDDVGATPINTLGNSALELDASRVRLGGDANSKYLKGQRWNEFLQGRLRRLLADEALSKDLRRLARLGMELTTWEIAHRTGHASAAELEARIRRSFPAVVASDLGANWSRWPGLPPTRGPSTNASHPTSKAAPRDAWVVGSGE